MWKDPGRAQWVAIYDGAGVKVYVRDEDNAGYEVWRRAQDFQQPTYVRPGAEEMTADEFRAAVEASLS